MQAKKNPNPEPQPQCRNIVRRAFRELRKCGVGEAKAFDSATKVYRLHHPEVPEREARYKVADWLE